MYSLRPSSLSQNGYGTGVGDRGSGVKWWVVVVARGVRVGDDMTYYAILCYDVLWYAAICYAMLWYAISTVDLYSLW